MASICSVSSISDRLIKWGLGEIKVQRMGAKSYLLTIEDEDLFLMLKDLEWSYLKEIFSDIRPWSETLSCSERATWLEFSGLPLHCWNAVTIKRLAEVWGTFDAMGVNANHTRDCEKGDKIFEVGVVELGFTDESSTVVGMKESEYKTQGENVQESESITNTTLEHEKNVEGKLDWSCSGTEDAALDAMCAEKDSINCVNQEVESLKNHFNVEELMGGISNGVKDVINEGCDLRWETRVVGRGIFGNVVNGPEGDSEGKVDGKNEARVSEIKTWAQVLNENFNPADPI
ncbi:hypothetical protein V6N13_142007 [Hibiscus sabdariffa]